jgi:hypothetical protein
MRRAMVPVALGLALVVMLPAGVAQAGGRLMRTGAPGGFRSPADFHSRQGLTGGYRSPGNFFARDSAASLGASPRIAPGGAVSFAPLLAWPSAVYSTPVDPGPAEIVVAPVTQVYSTVYVAPSALPAPATVAPPAPPAAPPAPTVIEYPTGRYELRGDGLAIPYAWVWVPNPPAGPPPAARAPADDGPPTRVYRWTDDSGTTYLTNRLDAVPPRQRSELPTPAPSPTGEVEAAAPERSAEVVRPAAGPPRPGG